MKNVLYQAKLLTKEIKHCNEYNQYIRTKNRLQQEEHLFQRMNEFRRRSMELQMSSTGNAFDEIVKLRQDYYDVLCDPLVNEFLVAEQRVCKLMRSVENTIFDELEFDTSFF